MYILEELDLKVRKIISFAFRIVVLLYAFIVVKANENLFPWYVYLGASVIYFIIFRYLYSKDKYYAHLRLLNDYAFFALILYGKELDNLLNLGLLLLPIVNSLNHSSYRRPPIFSLPLYIVALLCMLFLSKQDFDYSAIFALLALAVINIFSYFRASLIRFHSVIHGAIDKFYEENLNLGKTYLLLNNIVNALTKHEPYFKAFVPSEITCFKVKNGGLSIAASSLFITTFQIPDEASLIRKLRKEPFIKVPKLYINDAEALNCVLILVKGNQAQYVYCLQFPPNSLSFLHSLLVKNINPLLHKVVKVLEVEYDLKLQRRLSLNKIKSKLHYVDNTVKVIHYLNNKLTPITTYFDMVSKYDTIRDATILEQLAPLIESEKKKSARVIKDVIGRAHMILDKSLNPYFVEEIYDESFRRIFELVRGSWDDNDLDVKNIETSWSKSTYEAKTILNVDSFQFVLDEVIDNIKKHYHKFAKVEFLIIEGNPVIRFINDIKAPTLKSSNLKKLARDFNGAEINEIMKRNSHGTTFIKQYTTQMNIKTAIRIEANFEIILIFSVTNS
ncbi:hypothetical protein [Pontibacter saemangeumensis]|uniref:hypothetical protein n=1 Tax=Pontibacter saemangeumensis TaxID=1084525 RepID=UPI0031EC9B85